jgi:hypothetical protein
MIAWRGYRSRCVLNNALWIINIFDYNYLVMVVTMMFMMMSMTMTMTMTMTISHCDGRK